MFYFLVIPNAKTKHNSVQPKPHISQEKNKEKTVKKRQEIIKKATEVSQKMKVPNKSTRGFWRGLGKILKIFSFK